MAKRRITSKPGLFGMTYHYENGKYIGKSRPGLLGDRKIHYDADGRQVGTSRPGALSDEVHYDAKNKRYISSYQGLTGEIHMSNGRPVGKTTPGVFGAAYSSIDDNEVREIFDDEEPVDFMDEYIDEDDTDSDFKSQSPAKMIVKKVIGYVFVLETISFLVMTVVFALKGKNTAPGVAACVLSAVAAFFCFRSAMGNSEESDMSEYE